MACECIGWCWVGPQDGGKHHHRKCPGFETEKFPRLFYYEEAIDAWAPVPEKVDGEMICTADQLDDGEHMEIQFRRRDMTDKEFDELPED